MKTAGDYIIILIGIVGSLASIIGLLKFDFAGNDAAAIAVFFLGVISLFFLGYSIYLIMHTRKRIRYTGLLSELNEGFSLIHELDRRGDNMSKNEVYERFEWVCTSISRAFSVVHGHHIGVCIKLVFKEDNTHNQDRGMAITFCRDSKSSRAKGRLVGPSDKTNHWISGNSDFNFIFTNSENGRQGVNYFFSNHLPPLANYQNTNLDRFSWPPKRLGFVFLDAVNRTRQWPLPYKSTIVVPLCPLSRNSDIDKGLRGYLCIDSPNSNVFNEAYDVEILRGVADGLYNKIDKLYDRIKDEKVSPA